MTYCAHETTRLYNQNGTFIANYFGQKEKYFYLKSSLFVSILKLESYFHQMYIIAKNITQAKPQQIKKGSYVSVFRIVSQPNQNILKYNKSVCWQYCTSLYRAFFYLMENRLPFGKIPEQIKEFSQKRGILSLRKVRNEVVL